MKGTLMDKKDNASILNMDPKSTVDGGVEEFLSVVYTPIVGNACQKNGSIFKQPQGLFYISLNEKGTIPKVLKGKVYVPGQAKNAYIFLEFGVSLDNVEAMHDDMLSTASEALVEALKNEAI